MSRALITGGAGGLGLHLATYLMATGNEVVLADNFSRGMRDQDLQSILDHPNVSVVELDLRDPGTGLDTRFDYIYHLAALVGVATVLARPHDVLRENVLMAITALDLAQRQDDLKRFVFASTSEVYAGTLAEYGLPFPTPESVPLAIPDLAAPRTSYMLSKLYGEALGLQADVPFTALRPHNVYGPRMGMAHVIPEMLKRAWETPDDGEFEVPSADHTRTFCFARDATAMMVAAAEAADAEGEVINLGSEGPEVSMRRLAELVLGVVGKKVRIVELPPAEGSPPRRAPDMTKMHKLTGRKATTPLENGLESTFRWYRDNEFAGR